METPICKICMASELLCPADEKRLESGKISSADIQISRILYELSKKHKVLEDVKFKKAVNIGDEVGIIVGKGDKSKVIGKNGRIAKEISTKMKKNVLVLNEGNDVQEVVTSIIQPSLVRSINVVYAQSGITYKVLIDRRKMEDLPIKISHYESVLKDLTGKEVKIEGI